MKLSRYVSLFLWIFVYLGVASYIGQVTKLEIPDWYSELKKPPLNPPDVIFPIVWTVLYIMIAVSGWRLWQNRSAMGKNILGLFVLQTIMNWAWSFLFFKYHWLGLSFIWILAMIITLIMLLVLIRQRDHFSFLLLCPYLLWITFAAYLNGMIWYLN